MKNSRKALLFALFFKRLDENGLRIDLQLFLDENNITALDFYTHVVGAKDIAESIFLDYVNNFLSVVRFAEYYDLNRYDAELFINTMRSIIRKEFKAFQ